MAPNTTALKRLIEWMAQDPKVRTRSEIARRLKVSQPSVSDWILRVSRPEEGTRRNAIETLTDGYVRAVDWLTAKERRQGESVEPMRPTGTS